MESTGKESLDEVDQTPQEEVDGQKDELPKEEMPMGMPFMGDNSKISQDMLNR